MGLRCLIGHDFGEVLTDRDREERGDEVVVTAREYRECDRCGRVRVVSENKEVRHRDAGWSDEPTGGDDAGPVGGEATSEVDDYEGEGDDGVILEGEPESVGREHGAWPETDEPDEPAESDTEPSPWPEVEGEDEGFAAEVGDDSPLEGVEFSSGLTPEAAPSDPSQARLDEEVLESGRRGGSEAPPSPSPTGRQRSRAADTEFFCPECEFTTPTEDSSLRPGDICPSCRLGYLTEREQ